MLIVLAALAFGQPPLSDLGSSSAWTPSEWFMQYDLSTVEDACNTADEAEGNPVWLEIRSRQLNVTYTQCAQPVGVTFLASATNVECLAAYSPEALAGAYCTGPYCALAAAGNNAGIGCTGYKCAAYTGSGCPSQGTAETISTPLFVDDTEEVSLTVGIYGACCATGHGAGCVGSQCAYMCSSNLCGSMSIGEESSWSCQGTLCGQACQGTQCAGNCVGNQCGLQCWGTSCAQNSMGYRSGYRCMGAQCAYNCTGDECGQYCNGASCSGNCHSNSCGQGCTGTSCAAGCMGPSDVNLPCGQYATGTGSAANCVGHGCGLGCVGEACAQNSSSIYTNATVVESDSTAAAIDCFNRWIFKAMGLDYLTLTEASTTTAPGRRDRRVAVSSDPSEGSKCGITNGPVPDTATTSQGPGSFCVGSSCGQNADGAFAASYCTGTRCAALATGLYAGVACVGDSCASGAEGSFGAGSFCYGTRCAANSDGDWAGSYCIGNGCAQGCTGNRCGTCCIGHNCSSNTTSDCPHPTDGGVPAGLGIVGQLFSDECRNTIDTTSTAWTSFFRRCASGYNETELIGSFSTHCVIDCTEPLSMYLNYYASQMVRQTYGHAYAAQSLRGANLLVSSSNEEDNAYEIMTWVLVGVAVVLVGAVAWQCMKISGKFGSGISKTNGNIYFSFGD